MLVPGLAKVSGEAADAISFPVPLSAELAAANVVYLKVGEKVSGKCEGTAAAPTAAAGYLCVYAGTEVAEGGFKFKAIETPVGVAGASKYGAVVVFESSASESATKLIAYGTWAVSAP